MERVGMGKLSQGAIPTWAFSALSILAFPARCCDPCEAFIAKVDHGSIWNRSMVRPRLRGRRWSYRWVVVSAVVAVALGTTTFFATRMRAPRASDRHIHSIVVLPFANLSGDHSQEYFADAMTDELTSDLAKIAALRVISRTSAMHYKGTSPTAPQIARELKVDGMIEGSVLRTGNRVRITVQLIDARTDVHRWSESYERDLNDVLELQNEVAHTIAAQVQAVISPAEEARLRPQTVKPGAYEAYLLGRSQLEKWTVSGADEALKYFQHATEIDDHFALAYVGIAECYFSFLGVNGVSYREGLDRGMLALTRAIELNPEMSEAHAMPGALRMARDWDFAGAEAEMQRGISLSPGYGGAHHWYSQSTDVHGTLQRGYDRGPEDARTGPAVASSQPSYGICLSRSSRLGSCDSAAEKDS